MDPRDGLDESGKSRPHRDSIPGITGRTKQFLSDVTSLFSATLSKCPSSPVCIQQWGQLTVISRTDSFLYSPIE